MLLLASYHTLGCKLNFAETATIESLLKQKGIETAKKGQKPDFCIVNTCSVTETADKKARHLIRNLASRFPDADIIVTGCYAQLKPDEVATLPNVKLVVGANDKLNISGFIDSRMEWINPIIQTPPATSFTVFMPSCERGDRTRFFLKVQDGCDYYCSYCTIPYARGKSRSGLITDLTRMAEDVVEKGGKEIVITGVNIGTFGKDNGEKLLDLLKALDTIKGIERFRISSIEPNLLSEDIVKWIAHESRAFMPHFHIPLQSGSDQILSLMRRRYDTSLFKSRIDLIKTLIPHAFIGVDIITGARGETTEEWNKSLQFADSLDVSKYHIFPYSERPGTKALGIDHIVPVEERRKRVAALTEISNRKTKNFILQNIDIERKVLWEHPVGKNFMSGLTENYIRVEAPIIPDYLNSISKIRIKGLKHDSFDNAIAEHIID